MAHRELRGVGGSGEGGFQATAICSHGPKREMKNGSACPSAGTPLSPLMLRRSLLRAAHTSDFREAISLFPVSKMQVISYGERNEPLPSREAGSPTIFNSCFLTPGEKKKLDSSLGREKK